VTALDPQLFGPGSARDARFQVKDVWAEMVNFPPDHPEANREFLHRQMNEEVEGLELCARSLADFPDAPWEVRMEMARQCWDEARHAVAFRRAFEARGGIVGQYPVLTFQYRILTRIDTLAGRLAVQNRSFEAAGIDAIHHDLALARQAGESDVAELLEAQLADELQHVRYANRWVKELVAAGGPRASFDLVRAVAQADQAMRIVAGDAVVSFPVAEELRREAGFDEDEIRTVAQLTTRRL
jgi:uncharacterized ferritin-like protein (DUF455 family)